MMVLVVGRPIFADSRTVPDCSFPWIVARPFPSARFWTNLSAAEENQAAPTYYLGMRCSMPTVNHLCKVSVRGIPRAAA